MGRVERESRQHAEWLDGSQAVSCEPIDIQEVGEHVQSRCEQMGKDAEVRWRVAAAEAEAFVRAVWRR